MLPLISSQPPCQQQLASHSRLSQERERPGQLKGPDSARPPLCVQNARPSRFKRAGCTMLHLQRRSDRIAEGLHQLATVLPSLDPHRPVIGCWRGTYGVFDGGRAALIVRWRPSRSTRGTCQAKKEPESVMANPLPSRTKEELCYYYARRFLPVASGLAEAHSASSSSLLLWCYCFANHWRKTV